MPKNSKAISCKNVWKLYGSNPSKYLASKNFNPTIKDLKESQYIPAVFNASIDVYEGENIPSDKKSIALKVTIQSDHKTLNENDLTNISKKIVSTVEEETGAKLRS